jgi:hypothetical protein
MTIAKLSKEWTMFNSTWDTGNLLTIQQVVISGFYPSSARLRSPDAEAKHVTRTKTMVCHPIMKSNRLHVSYAEGRPRFRVEQSDLENIPFLRRNEFFYRPEIGNRDNNKSDVPVETPEFKSWTSVMNTQVRNSETFALLDASLLSLEHIWNQTTNCFVSGPQDLTLPNGTVVTGDRWWAKPQESNSKLATFCKHLSENVGENSSPV